MYQLILRRSTMAELKLEGIDEAFQATISYKENQVILKFRASKSVIEVSRTVCKIYMSGESLKEFSLCTNDGILVSLKDSVIESLKCQGNLYELQLNRIECKLKTDKCMDEAIIINLPPNEIDGLKKESNPKNIKALGTEITFVYNDETSTYILCPKEIRKILVSLISLYYLYPVETLQEFSKDANGQINATLRSQRRSFEDIGSRVNLHVKADNVVEFIKLANINHPHFQETPRYVRQFIDSFVVSEPQRFTMLFAMASSFAEYILEKKKQGGGSLVRETILHFNIEGLDDIKEIIENANLDRNGNRIETLADLRNECEHNLFSNTSYDFLENNPSVNVFLYKISCHIVMELAGFNTNTLL